ncbi:MAG TPA: hypothetical protein PKE47_13240 [Verrucomicrobiota bacterium]|nr:hypothetical protein [Verrucomicrobiota bacterium]
MKPLLLLLVLAASAVAALAAARPVLWYCLHYQAPGENRYPADGAYSEAMKVLARDFEVRVSAARPSRATLRGVAVVLISNPNEAAHGTNRPPAHVGPEDGRALERFVRRGGGLVVFGNQENHNLETENLNRHLLGRFGLRFSDLGFQDGKRYTLPANAPFGAGLRWAYYIGNHVVFAADHPDAPRPVLMNDPDRPALNGPRNGPGTLLAVAMPGQGRVVVATDAGWLGNAALLDQGVGGGFVIRDHDNAALAREMFRWAAGMEVKP